MIVIVSICCVNIHFCFVGEEDVVSRGFWRFIYFFSFVV